MSEFDCNVCTIIKRVLTTTELKLITKLRHYMECNQLQLNLLRAFSSLSCFSTTRETGLPVYRTAPAFNDFTFQTTICAVTNVMLLSYSTTWQPTLNTFFKSSRIQLIQPHLFGHFAPFNTTGSIAHSVPRSQIQLITGYNNQWRHLVGTGYVAPPHAMNAYVSWVSGSTDPHILNLRTRLT
jgi:hypothetical protein